MIVTNVIQQHADDATALAETRQAHIRAPFTNLQRLAAADRRLLANLDGLRLAGDAVGPFYDAMRAKMSAGAVFVLTTQALEVKDQASIEGLIAVAQTLPSALDGLLSAFEWVEPVPLRGTVAALLGDPNQFKRMLGVAACGMHRVDPGLVDRHYLHDRDSGVRARAYRTAGELGLQALSGECEAASRTDGDPEVQYWAGWSAALLGEQDRSLKILHEYGASSASYGNPSFRLSLQMMPPSVAHRTLQQLAPDSAHLRRLIEGSGIAGDPVYVAWLIRHMAELETTRLAGEAFTLISGLNLGLAALDRPAPQNFESGPSDDPNDASVDVDPDDGLPWPDVDKIEEWWAANESRFQKGTRYFMGQPVTREHCIDVLKSGYQRQRILAAQYLCLLEPGTPLFNTSAPAWRQQRLLAAM